MFAGRIPNVNPTDCDITFSASALGAHNGFLIIGDGLGDSRSGSFFSWRVLRSNVNFISPETYLFPAPQNLSPRHPKLRKHLHPLLVILPRVGSHRHQDTPA